MENKVIYNLIILELNALKLIHFLNNKFKIPINDLNNEYEIFLEKNIGEIIKNLENSSENIVSEYRTDKNEIYLGTDDWIVSQSNIE